MTYIKEFYIVYAKSWDGSTDLYCFDDLKQAESFWLGYKDTLRMKEFLAITNEEYLLYLKWCDKSKREIKRYEELGFLERVRKS